MKSADFGRLPATYNGQTEAEEYAADPAAEGQARIADLLEASIALATDVLLLPVDSTVRPEIRAPSGRVCREAPRPPPPRGTGAAG